MGRVVALMVCRGINQHRIGRAGVVKDDSISIFGSGTTPHESLWGEEAQCLGLRKAEKCAPVQGRARPLSKADFDPTHDPSAVAQHRRLETTEVVVQLTE
jgi:hypothetical protein